MIISCEVLIDRLIKLSVDDCLQYPSSPSEYHLNVTPFVSDINNLTSSLFTDESPTQTIVPSSLQLGQKELLLNAVRRHPCSAPPLTVAVLQIIAQLSVQANGVAGNHTHTARMLAKLGFLSAVLDALLDLLVLGAGAGEDSWER